MGHEGWQNIYHIEHTICPAMILSYTIFLFPVTGAIKTYFKTLKAKRKRVATHIRVQGKVTNKQTESVIVARRNQRGHNVSVLLN